MELSKIESMVLDRVEKENWTLEPFKDLAKVVEELGELSREIRRIEDGRERPDEQAPKREDVIKEIASETGDILFPLVKIIRYYKIILDETTLNKALSGIKNDVNIDVYLELTNLTKEIGRLSSIMIASKNQKDESIVRFTNSLIINFLINLQTIASKYGFNLDEAFLVHQEKMNKRYK